MTLEAARDDAAILLFCGALAAVLGLARAWGRAASVVARARRPPVR
jgi:hypothetical protein